MNERIRLFVDIDGVACAHAKAICMRVNEDYGLSSSINNVLSWNHDFGPITFVEAVEKYYPLNGFVLKMQPTPGFKEFLKEITSFSIVSFVTTRTHAKAETVAWIKMHFGTSYKIDFVSDKSILDYDLLIDDSEKEVVAAANKGSNAILFTQPWNDHPEVDELLRRYRSAWRARNFQDILSILCRVDTKQN